MLQATILAMTTMSCIFIEAQERDAIDAVKLLQSMGVSVQAVGTPAEYGIELVGQHDAQRIKDALVLVQQLPRLRRLYVSCEAFDDDCSRLLAKLPELREIKLSNTLVTPEGIQSLVALDYLTSVNISSSEHINDAVFGIVSEIDALEILILNNTAVRGIGLSSLQKNKRLRSLSLNKCELVPQGIRELGTLVGLQNVSLQFTPIDDGTLRNLSGMIHMVELDVSFTNVSGSSISSLGGMTKLRSLSFNKATPAVALDFDERDAEQGVDAAHRDISDANEARYFEVVRRLSGGVRFGEMPSFPSLEKLCLVACDLDQGSYQRICECSAIRFLDLRGSSVCDSDIDILKKCKNIKNLFVENTAITSAGRQKLRDFFGQDVALSCAEQRERDAESN